MKTCILRHGPVRTGKGNCSRPAFSLIEMLGVLAIIAILALVLTPVLIRSFDEIAREKEKTTMRRLAIGLEHHIARDREVPDAGGLAAAIAAELGMKPANVLTNDRQLRRVFLLDPAAATALGLPYRQAERVLTNSVPPMMGVVLISSASHELPEELVSGVATNSAAFSNIWNVADSAIPAGWNWQGRAEDLHIERLNLSDLFSQVVLNYVGTNAGFSVDRSEPIVLPSNANVFSAHYLKGTVLDLYGTDDPPTEEPSSVLQVTDVIRDDIAYTYTINRWRNSLYLVPSKGVVEGVELESARETFEATLPPTGTSGGFTPTQVIDEVASFMDTYVSWAETDFQDEDLHSVLITLQEQLANNSREYLAELSEFAPIEVVQNDDSPPDEPPVEDEPPADEEPPVDDPEEGDGEPVTPPPHTPTAVSSPNGHDISNVIFYFSDAATGTTYRVKFDSFDQIGSYTSVAFNFDGSGFAGYEVIGFSVKAANNKLPGGYPGEGEYMAVSGTRPTSSTSLGEITNLAALVAAGMIVP